MSCGEDPRPGLEGFANVAPGIPSSKSGVVPSPGRNGWELRTLGQKPFNSKRPHNGRPQPILDCNSRNDPCSYDALCTPRLHGRAELYCGSDDMTLGPKRPSIGQPTRTLPCGDASQASAMASQACTGWRIWPRELQHLLHFTARRGFPTWSNYHPGGMHQFLFSKRLRPRSIASAMPPPLTVNARQGMPQGFAAAMWHWQSAA